MFIKKHFYLFICSLLFYFNAVSASSYQNPPYKDSDEYATYVLDITSKYSSMSWNDIQRYENILRQQINNSNSHIIDLYTLNVIETLLLSAIRGSITFQRLLMFAESEGGIPLSEIEYRTIYEDREGVELDREITADEIITSSHDSVDVIVISEAGEDVSPHQPYINVSVSPNSNNVRLFPHYQESIIHELVHHLTMSGDPNENGHGPTELLANNIIQELGIPYSIFTYSGYLDPLRLTAISIRNHQSLIDMVERASNEERDLDRLADLSSRNDVEPLYTRYVFFTQQQSAFNVLSHGITLFDGNHHLHDFINNQPIGPTTGIVSGYRLRDMSIGINDFHPANGGLVSAIVRIEGNGLANLQNLTENAYDFWLTALTRLGVSLSMNLRPQQYTEALHLQMMSLYLAQRPHDILVRNLLSGLALQAQALMAHNADEIPVYLYTSIPFISIESVSEWRWVNSAVSWQSADEYHVTGHVFPIEPSPPSIAIPPTEGGAILPSPIARNITAPSTPEIIEIVNNLMADYNQNFSFCNLEGVSSRTSNKNMCSIETINSSSIQPETVSILTNPFFF